MSRRSGASRRPGRASRVIERVTNAPSRRRSAYAASSRPVPPHPAATMTGEDRVSAREGDGHPPEADSHQVAPADPVAAEHRPVDAGAGRARRAVLADDRDRAAVAQPGGADQRLLQGGLAPGAGRLGGLRDGVQERRRVRRRRRRRRCAWSSPPREVTRWSSTRPRRPDRAVGGDDRDRPGRPAGLEGGRAGAPRRAPATTRVTAQPRSRSRSASGNSGAAAWPCPTARSSPAPWAARTAGRAGR